MVSGWYLPVYNQRCYVISRRNVQFKTRHLFFFIFASINDSELSQIRRISPDYRWYLVAFCGTLTHYCQDKMSSSLRTGFRIQRHFLEWKLLYFDWYLIEIFSQWFSCQYSSIGSSNGSVPNMRQAIIWTNDGLVYWRIYAAPVQDELWFTLEEQAINLETFARGYRRMSVDETDCVLIWNVTLLRPCFIVFHAKA